MKRGVAHVVRPMGYLTCIAAPAVAVVDQFGYMIGEQEASWLDLIPCSGLVLFLFLLCIKPVFNWVARHLKSDTEWKMWLIVTVVGGIGAYIGESMFIIGCFGVVGNLVGHLMIASASRALTKTQGGVSGG